MATFTVNDVYLTGYLADVSTASSSFIAIPEGVAGEVIGIKTVLFNAITVANSALTFEINGTAITGAGITVAFSGSAAGDIDSSAPTAARSVKPGDALELVSDGGSTTTAPLAWTVQIRR